MVSAYVDKKALGHVMAALMPSNALACRVSLATGLRIGDVLQLRPEQLKKQRFTIREQKTGKTRRVYLPKELHAELLAQAGEHWVFPGRDPKMHRTRQTVWADVKRARKAFRMRENVSPHSMRKIAAVEEFRRTGDLSKVQRFLNHDDPMVTMIYAMADQLARQKPGKKKKRPP